MYMRYMHVTNIYNTCRWCQQTARRCTPFSKTIKKQTHRLGVNTQQMKPVMMVRRMYEALSYQCMRP